MKEAQISRIKWNGMKEANHITMQMNNVPANDDNQEPIEYFHKKCYFLLLHRSIDIKNTKY